MKIIWIYSSGALLWANVRQWSQYTQFQFQGVHFSQVYQTPSTLIPWGSLARESPCLSSHFEYLAIIIAHIARKLVNLEFLQKYRKNPWNNKDLQCKSIEKSRFSKFSRFVPNWVMKAVRYSKWAHWVVFQSQQAHHELQSTILREFEEENVKIWNITKSQNFHDPPKNRRIWVNIRWF